MRELLWRSLVRVGLGQPALLLGQETSHRCSPTFVARIASNLDSKLLRIQIHLSIDPFYFSEMQKKVLHCAHVYISFELKMGGDGSHMQIEIFHCQLILKK